LQRTSELLHQEEGTLLKAGPARGTETGGTEQLNRYTLGQ